MNKIKSQPKPVPVILSQVQDLAHVFVQLHIVFVSLLFCLSRSLSKMALLSDVSTSLPSLVSSANLVRVLSISSLKSFMKMLNSMGPSIIPWGTLLVTGCQSK